MAKTIILKGGFERKEGVASEAITPGHLIEFGGSKDVQKHSTADGNCRKAFALENDLVGNGVDDAYAAGDTVQYGVFQRGAEANALLAYGENVSKGDALTSAGDGTLQKASTSSSTTQAQRDSIAAYAAEAVNNNSGGAAVRIAVEVA